MSNDNTTVLEQQVADLKKGLETSRAENEAIKAKIEEAKDKEFAATIEAQRLNSKKPKLNWLHAKPL